MWRSKKAWAMGLMLTAAVPQVTVFCEGDGWDWDDWDDIEIIEIDNDDDDFFFDFWWDDCC